MLFHKETKILIFKLKWLYSGEKKMGIRNSRGCVQLAFIVTLFYTADRIDNSSTFSWYF